MEIKTNIPIPNPHINSQFSVVASQMNEGDCIDVEKSQAVPMCQAIRRQAYQAEKRRLDNLTWRVWRTQ